MTSLFFARPVRETGDYLLFCDGFQFGRLANCEVAHVFESSDEELTGRVVAALEGNMSLREMLVVIRRAYEAQCEFDRKLAASEHAAENAWLHHAERYDPEAQADLALHDALHPYGYC